MAMGANNIDKCGGCEKCIARSASVFQDLPSAQLKEVDNIRKLIQFDKKRPLSVHVNAEPGFYCIRSGHIRECLTSQMRDKILRICGPGDLAGFGSDAYSLSSLEAGEACFLSFEKFEKLHTLFPNITHNIIKALFRIVQIKDSRISSLENHNAKNRVASLLVSLSNKFGESSKFGVKIAAYVDRITMARLAGTSPETFARIITEMQVEGIIARDKRNIHILNLEKLKESSE